MQNIQDEAALRIYTKHSNTTLFSIHPIMRLPHHFLLRLQGVGCLGFFVSTMVWMDYGLHGIFYLKSKMYTHMPYILILIFPKELIFQITFYLKKVAYWICEAKSLCASKTKIK